MDNDLNRVILGQICTPRMANFDNLTNSVKVTFGIPRLDLAALTSFCKVVMSYSQWHAEVGGGMGCHPPIFAEAVSNFMACR